MPLLSFFRSSEPSSAQVAKERLQIVIAHERNQRSFHFMPELKRELLEVIRKYVKIDNEDDVKFKMEREGDYEVLELNVTLPDDAVPVDKPTSNRVKR